MHTEENKRYFDTQQRERLKVFASFISGSWHSDEQNQENLMSQCLSNKALTEEIKKQVQDFPPTTEKCCLMTIPSFRLSKHSNQHHGEIDNKEELEEIAMSQLSEPFTFPIPISQREHHSIESNCDMLLKYLRYGQFTVTQMSSRLAKSLVLLLDSRLNSYSHLLLSHYQSHFSESGLQDLTNSAELLASLDWKLNTLLNACNDIHILNTTIKFEVNESCNDIDETVYEDDYVVEIPLSFSFQMEVQLPESTCSYEIIEVSLNCTGSMYGSFYKSNDETELYSASITVDSKNVLKSLINHARAIGRKIVGSVSSFDTNSTSSLVSTGTGKEVANSGIDKNVDEIVIKPILKSQQSSSKRKKVSFLQTPDLSSENSLPKLLSMEKVSLTPPAIDPQSKNDDCEFVTIIDSVMELWDLALTNENAKRRKVSPPMAASFLQSY